MDNATDSMPPPLLQFRDDLNDTRPSIAVKWETSKEKHLWRNSRIIKAVRNLPQYDLVDMVRMNEHIFYTAEDPRPRVTGLLFSKGKRFGEAEFGWKKDQSVPEIAKSDEAAHKAREANKLAPPSHVARVERETFVERRLGQLPTIDHVLTIATRTHVLGKNLDEMALEFPKECYDVHNGKVDHEDDAEAMQLEMEIINAWIDDALAEDEKD